MTLIRRIRRAVLFTLLFLISLPFAIAQSCNPGTSSETGSVPCTDCEIGTFQPSIGQTSCLACEAGTFQENIGAIACNDCPAGFGSLQGSSSCTQCAAGEYVPAEGGACTDCPAGKYTNVVGQTACFDCPAGEGSEEGGTFCAACPAGTASQEGTGCQDCEAGSFTSTFGQTACLNCEAGSGSEAGDTSCSLCEVGYFSASAGDACTACPTGSYSTETGSTSCTECSLPYVSFTGGTSYCQRCKRLKKLKLVVQDVENQETQRVTFKGHFFTSRSQYSDFTPNSTGFSVLFYDSDGNQVLDLSLPGEDNDGEWIVKNSKKFKRFTFVPQESSVVSRFFVKARKPAKGAKSKVTMTLILNDSLSLTSETSFSSFAISYGTDEGSLCAYRRLKTKSCKYSQKKDRTRCK